MLGKFFMFNFLAEHDSEIKALFGAVLKTFDKVVFENDFKIAFVLQ